MFIRYVTIYEYDNIGTVNSCVVNNIPLVYMSQLVYTRTIIIAIWIIYDYRCNIGTCIRKYKVYAERKS